MKVQDHDQFRASVLVSAKTKDPTLQWQQTALREASRAEVQSEYAFMEGATALGTRYEIREEVRDCLVQAVSVNQVESSQIRSDHLGRSESAEAFTWMVSTGHIIWNN